MNVLSLFDGMSCGQIALDRLGIKVDNYFASEIDKHAIKVTKANYPNTKHLGSVVDVKAADLPKIDLLIGGSPCQSFSFAGKRKGMSTKCNQEILTLEHYLQLKTDGFQFEGQSYLFWEYMRLLKECNPKYFLLENVMMGQKWQRILSQNIGIDPIMINSSLLSAQNRKRLYWTNIGTNTDNLFGIEQPGIKQPKDKCILLKDVLESEVDDKYDVNLSNNSVKKNMDIINNSINNLKSTCIDGSYYKGFGTRCGKCRQVVKTDRKGKPKKNQNKADSLSVGGNGCGNHSDMDLLYIPENTNQNKPIQLNKAKEWGGGPRQQNRVYSTDAKSPNLDTTSRGKKILIPESTKKGFAEIEDGQCFDATQPNSKTRRGRKMDKKTNCLTTNTPEFYLYKNAKIRRLTPIECERLQTVPDNYTNFVSDSQRYKMLGNGWTVDVVAYIFKHIK